MCFSSFFFLGFTIFRIVEWSRPRYRRGVTLRTRKSLSLPCREDVARATETRREGLGKGSSHFLYLFVTHSPRRAHIFFSPVRPQVFSLPAFFPSRCPPQREDEQRHSAGDKSRISCCWRCTRSEGGLPEPAATAAAPPLTFRGRNLSVADDPLKRICPRTRQCMALRAATREVIQRHATSPTRLT